MACLQADELIAEVAGIAVLVARDEMAGGVLPTDRLAHIIRAAIETYLIFAARCPSRAAFPLERA